MNFKDLPKRYSDENNIVYDIRNTKYSIFNNDHTSHVLNEDIVFGKDYPTNSIDFDTHQILSYFRHGPLSLDRVLNNIELKTLYGEGLLKEIIIENNYLLPTISKDFSLKEEISKMDASQLTHILRKYGINASGKKKKLVKLALENINLTDIEDCEFTLTDEGLKFLEDYEWIGLYDFSLGDFEFDDFCKYLDENGYEDFIQTSLDYLNEHEKNAHAQKDFGYVCDCYNARIYIFIYCEKDFNALIEDIKHYIFRINPIYDYEDYYSSNSLLDYHDIEEIKILSEQFEIDKLEIIFNEVWDSMNLEKEFIGKKEAYELLEKLFDKEEFDELSNDYLDIILSK